MAVRAYQQQKKSYRYALGGKYMSKGQGSVATALLWLLTVVSGVPSVRAQAHSATRRTLSVPLIYEDRAAGTATLTLDFGAPFDILKPTVLVIADGQQFYVRPDAMKDLQESTFGDGVNVVGIITRGTTPAFIRATLDASGKADWPRAWKVFNSTEWLNDIESVRRSLVGEEGQIDLYGRSGGAYLVHQYLARYGQHVKRAFTQSAVNPYLNAELGISLDTYWSDLGRQDPALQKELQDALAAHPQERINILMTLQRQHFFVSVRDIASARSSLIHALVKDDMEAYRKARKEYEVDEMDTMYASTDIIPQNVRVLELIAPSGAFDRLTDGGIYPLAETQAFQIKALLSLLHTGDIRITQLDFAALHRCVAEVFVLAARYDEAVDYRTQIALASEYPNHLLFLADDNHVLGTLAANGTSKQLITSFFAGGIDSMEFSKARQAATPYRWTEK